MIFCLHNMGQLERCTAIIQKWEWILIEDKMDKLGLFCQSFYLCNCHSVLGYFLGSIWSFYFMLINLKDNSINTPPNICLCTSIGNTICAQALVLCLCTGNWQRISRITNQEHYPLCFSKHWISFMIGLTMLRSSKLTIKLLMLHCQHPKGGGSFNMPMNHVAGYKYWHCMCTAESYGGYPFLWT